jgi:uncharacterized radical SAM protein YgiQ
MNKFLPTSRREMQDRGWNQLDIIIVSGDAYVDHPSFGPVIVARHLESLGFKVGVISQPDWKTDVDFLQLGKPRLLFGISSGNMDSMINHYTAQKKIRSEDAYSPGGKSGLRPNRAAIVYSQKVRALFKDVPIVLGGVEASLRRLPHYDFWSDKIRNSILFDAKADMLVYGMGERPISEIAQQLAEGKAVSDLTKIRGTVFISKPNLGEIDMQEFSGSYTPKEFWKLHDQFEKDHREKILSMKFAGRYLIHNPPAKPLSSKGMDELYDLPFTRESHPKYKGKKIPAFEQIKNSITSHRGCFGGCSFCAIGSHQGKSIQSRSKSSILKEVRELTHKDYFQGTISDVGGPTANMYGMSCKLNISETCKRTSCLYPQICPNLNSNHKPYRNILKEVRSNSNVKHTFVSSGFRFDLGLLDEQFIKDLAEHHTSGLLKLAPEHKSDKVLTFMNKPSFDLYEKFGKYFGTYSKQIGKKQFIVPYIIVGHPGATLKDTIELAIYLKKHKMKLDQIQEFTPTPMTVSTMMYYTELDLKGYRIHVPKGREIRLMKALVQWYFPANKKLIIEALKNAGKTNLINYFLD